MSSFLKQVDLQRTRIIRDLLPDICQITPASGSGVVISGGVMTSSAPALRTWRTLTDIPCRIDIDRAFRPDKFKAQVTVVDEYTLELPFDVTVVASDKITLRGRHFTIRKIKNASNFDATVECIVTEVETSIDNV